MFVFYYIGVRLVADSDLEILEEVANDLELADIECELFTRVIACIYDPEIEVLSDSLKEEINRYPCVQVAIVKYFEKNPLTKEDLQYH